MVEPNVSAIKKEPVAPKAAKAPKAPKDPNAPKTTRARLAKFPDEHFITVLKPDSKLRIAAERFKLYRTGMTVKEYVDVMAGPGWERTAGQTQADMRWDLGKGFIHIGEVVVPVPAPPPAQPSAAA